MNTIFTLAHQQQLQNEKKQRLEQQQRIQLLISAAATNDLETLQEVLRQSSGALSRENVLAQSPTAAATGDNMTRQRRGAPINNLKMDTNTPTSDTVYSKNNILHGFSLKDAHDYDQRYSLHLAATEGHLLACKLLVEYHHDVNPTDRFGHTPFDDALRARHYVICEYLASRGGRVGPNLSENRDHFYNSLILREYHVIEVMLKAQFDPNFIIHEHNSIKQTPITWAIEQCDVIMTKILLHYNADLNYHIKGNNAGANPGDSQGNSGGNNGTSGNNNNNNTTTNNIHTNIVHNDNNIDDILLHDEKERNRDKNISKAPNTALKNQYLSPILLAQIHAMKHKKGSQAILSLLQKHGYLQYSDQKKDNKASNDSTVANETKDLHIEETRGLLDHNEPGNNNENLNNIDTDNNLNHENSNSNSNSRSNSNSNSNTSTQNNKNVPKYIKIPKTLCPFGRRNRSSGINSSDNDNYYILPVPMYLNLFNIVVVVLQVLLFIGFYFFITHSEGTSVIPHNTNNKYYDIPIQHNHEDLAMITSPNMVDYYNLSALQQQYDFYHGINTTTTSMTSIHPEHGPNLFHNHKNDSTIIYSPDHISSQFTRFLPLSHIVYNNNQPDISRNLIRFAYQSDDLPPPPLSVPPAQLASTTILSTPIVIIFALSIPLASLALFPSLRTQFTIIFPIALALQAFPTLLAVAYNILIYFAYFAHCVYMSMFSSEVLADSENHRIIHDILTTNSEGTSALGTSMALSIGIFDIMGYKTRLFVSLVATYFKQHQVISELYTTMTKHGHTELSKIIHHDTLSTPILPFNYLTAIMETLQNGANDALPLSNPTLFTLPMSPFMIVHALMFASSVTITIAPFVKFATSFQLLCVCILHLIGYITVLISTTLLFHLNIFPFLLIVYTILFSFFISYTLYTFPHPNRSLLVKKQEHRNNSKTKKMNSVVAPDDTIKPISAPQTQTVRHTSSIHHDNTHSIYSTQILTNTPNYNSNNDDSYAHDLMLKPGIFDKMSTVMNTMKASTIVSSVVNYKEKFAHLHQTIDKRGQRVSINSAALKNSVSLSYNYDDFYLIGAQELLSLHSTPDSLSFIATLLLWVALPVLSTILLQPHTQYTTTTVQHFSLYIIPTIINTVLSLSACCISSFCTAHLFRSSAFSIKHIHLATIGSGIMMLFINPLLIARPPFVSIALGAVCGVVTMTILIQAPQLIILFGSHIMYYFNTINPTTQVKDVNDIDDEKVDGHDHEIRPGPRQHNGVINRSIISSSSALVPPSLRFTPFNYNNNTNNPFTLVDEMESVFDGDFVSSHNTGTNNLGQTQHDFITKLQKQIPKPNITKNKSSINNSGINRDSNNNLAYNYNSNDMLYVDSVVFSITTAVFGTGSLLGVILRFTFNIFNLIMTFPTFFPVVLSSAQSPISQQHALNVQHVLFKYKWALFINEIIFFIIILVLVVVLGWISGIVLMTPYDFLKHFNHHHTAQDHLPLHLRLVFIALSHLNHNEHFFSHNSFSFMGVIMGDEDEAGADDWIFSPEAVPINAHNLQNSRRKAKRSRTLRGKKSRYDKNMGYSPVRRNPVDDKIVGINGNDLHSDVLSTTSLGGRSDTDIYATRSVNADTYQPIFPQSKKQQYFQ